MYDDLSIRDWQAAFAYYSSNTKKIVVIQAPLGVRVVVLESLC